MDRENFYLLLELSMDPPEEDPVKIEEAIKRMQTTWSRLRNHPTKGIQAKSYIGLIPEIRKVMTDPALRRAEASAAKDEVQQQQVDIFTEIDRHLTLHLSKGYVTDQEITKLANLHSIDESEIRARIKQMEQEKLAELDSQLSMRMVKGYVTVEEISKLAKTYGVSEKELKKRVNVPIRKGGEADRKTAKVLDKSIEKGINDNLKIVGKKSLYEFLGLAETSSQELLIKTAREKEAQILRISRKDATVTAGGILAGQCASVFRNAETRAAYDISRGRSRLKELDADIDVAGIDGKIRTEYFDILVKTAKGLGMDAEEAAKYIKRYCRDKKYVIAGMEKKKLSRNQFMVGAVLVVIFAVSVLAGFFVYKNMQTKSDFKEVLANVQGLTTLELKLRGFQEYVKTHEPSKYTDLANQKILETRGQIAAQKEKRAFKNTLKQVEAHLVNTNFQKSIAVLDSYLKAYPKGAHVGQAKKKIEEINARFDTLEYETLQAMTGAEVDIRLSAYMKYLRNHSKGQYQDQIKRLIWDMSEEYYIFIDKKIKASINHEDWTGCIKYCDSYINVYDNIRARQLKDKKEAFETSEYDQAVFEKLEAKARRLGTDYGAAITVYKDFLRAYPRTTVKNKINTRIVELEKTKIQSAKQADLQMMRNRIKATGRRFVEKTPATVYDTQTGLTWAMLDSQMILGRCLNFDDAKKYVNGLKIGQVSGWRLPDAKELFSLYKTKPFFPSQSSKRFWTSKSYTRYADQTAYQRVHVVTSDPETTFETLTMDSWECAVVHAVKR